MSKTDQLDRQAAASANRYMGVVAWPTVALALLLGVAYPAVVALAVFGFLSLWLAVPLVAFITYMRMFFRPVRDIAEKFNVMQNAMSSAERIFGILESENTEPDAPDGDALPAGNVSRQSVRSIVFGDVSFEE